MSEVKKEEKVKVKILKGCIVDKAPARPNDVIEVSKFDAKYLITAEKAEKADEKAPLFKKERSSKKEEKKEASPKKEDKKA